MRGRSQRRGNIHSCALSEFCLNLQNGRYTKEESQGKSGRLGWGGSMLKILVIDDSVLMRRVVRDHLEKEGFAVEEFLPASVLELMERVKTSPPDLVLSDFNMPYVDGLEVARNVRRVNPNIPVIILTANRDVAREAKLQTVGVRKVLYKPINGEMLVDAVRRILADSGIASN